MGQVITVGLDLAKSVFGRTGWMRPAKSWLRGGSGARRCCKMARIVWAMMVTGERYREPLAA